MTGFEEILNRFIHSNDSMIVVHGSNNESSKFDEHTPIYILDSSFNPPHLGHIQLIQSATGQQNHISSDIHNNGHLILLLSINNADKAPAPASFNQRLDMMNELGQYLLQQSNIPLQGYTILLSKSSRFIDKSHEINQIYPKGVKHYLLGFDTLIRVFNQKYYSIPIAEALDEFVSTNRFICLTRDQQIDSQLNYLEQLKNGDLGLPIHWGDNIKMIVNDLDTCSISSSSIRDLYKKRGKSDGSDESDIAIERTIPGIRSYILVNNLYHE